MDEETPSLPRFGTTAGRTAGRIVESYLPDGVRALRLRDRPTPSCADIEHGSAADRLEPARVITMAWGDRYVDDLVEITIPALLAPGNLPAFGKEFDCEFVIVTETRLFDRLTRCAAIAALLDHADLRLVPVDDLLSPWYGITLTYALVRGFADLGAAMTQTHLVFLNADFIVADGSYRKLAEMIKRGERLVVSPSYCINLEDTIDTLRRRRDRANGAISLPRRELAQIIIANRHNTIRAKTVNQQMFRIHRYDQFYWYVDDRTLLGRQMPIAVVYMRPERALTEMPTFWDYGVISEYCPTLTPCVLGDSDDFLMAELRGEGTFRELLHLGWPTVDEIAADLSSFTTQDHRDYGRYTLVLHAGDLPSGIDAAKAELAIFADRVYARLKPAIGYRDHPFWAPQFPQFVARHEEELRKRRAAQAAKATLVQDPREAARWGQIKELRAEILAIDAEIRLTRQQLAEKRRSAETRLAEIDDEHRHRRATVEGEIEATAMGEETDLRRLHARLAALETAIAGLERQQHCAIRRRSIGSAPAAGSPEASDKSFDPPAIAHSISGARRRMSHGASLIFFGWSGRLYRKAFGKLPHTTPWHPYHTMLRPIMAAASTAVDAAEVLVVSSGGVFAPLIAGILRGRTFTIAPGLLDSEFYQQTFRTGPGFDLCLCDLDVDDLVRFRVLLERIHPLLSKRSRVVVFHQNLAGRALDDWTHEFARGLFPLVGRSQIVFAGSRPGALSMRWFAKSLERHNMSRPWTIAGLAATLLVCAPLARLAAWIEERRHPRRMPAHCTSMTIEIDLP